MALNDLESQK